MNDVTIKASKGIEFSIEKTAVANINSKNCVNCGRCREVCPVGAIHENQRAICRVCPTCTGKPAMTINEMYALPTERACTTACPLGISPQGYVNLTKAGKPEAAYKLIWEKNPLLSVCSYICHHPCEQDCKRGLLVDEPISIRGIKRYLCETIDFKPDKYPLTHEETVAVVGAGPAGLTAAHYLASDGYEVTIFDSASEAGGMLKRGIPEFRLPRQVIDADISRLQDAGIHFCMNEKINNTKLEKMKKEYDAIVIATGNPVSKELKIEGNRLEGVMTALGFMERVNSGQEIWRHPGQIFKEHGDVVVIGGGSVAIDAARTAVRLGASSVTAVCLESGEDVPCHPWELQEAYDEGVTLLEGWSPQRYTGLYPKLTGVELAKVNNFKKSEDGKISFDIDKNIKKTLNADLVIVAIGQASDPIAKENRSEGIFYAGDLSGSACSVVDAMASGKKTASDVDAMLQGRELKDVLALRKLNAAPVSEKIYPAARRKTVRPERPMLDAEYRKNNFDVVEKCFDEEDAINEVNRCLGCGYQEVDTDKCIGCGVCQRLCPKGDAITMVRVGLEGGEA